MERKRGPRLTRRGFLGTAALAASVRAGGALPISPERGPRVPVVDITDLYHPPQDPGDNLDLIAAYALPEVDLRAVVLDVTQRYRRPYQAPDGGLYSDPLGGRDPGFIPVWQLNWIFNRQVPCAAAPFEPMRGPEDRMEDAPPFQQAGISLLLDTLRQSPEPVEIVSFGSARPLAVALNREPELLREKTRRVRLCAGAAPAGYLEWNVQLDVHAFVRVLQSDLPLALYPCATETDVFVLGPHNTYWLLPDLSLIRRVAPQLRRYIAYAFERSSRVDFLAAMEDEPSGEAVDRIAALPHNVWETDVWMHTAGRRLVRRAGGEHRILPPASVLDTDTDLTPEIRPCRIDVRPDGHFDFTLSDSPERAGIFHRPDPPAHQRALIEALPELYASFSVNTPHAGAKGEHS